MAREEGMGDVVRQLHHLTNSLDSSVKEQALLTQEMKDFRTSMPAIIRHPMQTTLNQLRSEMVSTFGAFANSYQKSTLSFGQTATEAAHMFGSNMDKAVGGFENIMRTNVTMLEGGLRGASKETQLLILRTQALGQDTVRMGSFLRGLTVTLGMNSAQVGEAAEFTRQLSNTYQISSERLIAAIEALAPQVKDAAALLGGGGGLAKSVEMAVATFGAGSEGLISSFTNALLDSGLQGTMQATLSNLQGMRQDIITGKGGPGAIIDAAKTSGARFQHIVDAVKGTGGDTLLALNILEQQYGKVAVQGAKLWGMFRNLTPEQLKLSKKQFETQVKFNDTLGLLYKEIVTPIKAWIADLPWKDFFALIKENMPLLKKLAAMVVIFGGIMFILGVIMTVMTVIASIIGSILGTLAGILAFAASWAIPALITWLATGMPKSFGELVDNLNSLVTTINGFVNSKGVRRFMNDPIKEVQFKAGEMLGAGTRDQREYQTMIEIAATSKLMLEQTELGIRLRTEDAEEERRHVALLREDVREQQEFNNSLWSQIMHNTFGVDSPAERAGHRMRGG